MSVSFFSSTNIVLTTDNGREFKIVHGEVFEEIQGEGFVVTTKVVVRGDLRYIARQFEISQEIYNAQ